jgi:hypothetical protein
VGACGFSSLFSYLNGLNFKPIETLGPEYKSKENIIVSTGVDAVLSGGWRQSCARLLLS